MVAFTHSDEFITNLNALAYPAPLVAVLYDTQASNLNSGTFTESVDVSGNVITVTGHPFGSAGDYADVQFTAGGTLDSAISASTTYVLRVIDANTVSIATNYTNARAATYISLNGNGAGTTTIAEQAVSRKSAIEYVTRKEVANANGYARQTITLTGTFDDADLRAELEDSTVDFTAAGGAIIASGYALFKSSSATYGSTTGDMVGHATFTSTLTINDTATQSFPTRINNLSTAFATTGT